MRVSDNRWQKVESLWEKTIKNWKTNIQAYEILQVLTWNSNTGSPFKIFKTKKVTEPFYHTKTETLFKMLSVLKMLAD